LYFSYLLLLCLSSSCVLCVHSFQRLWTPLHSGVKPCTRDVWAVHVSIRHTRHTLCWSNQVRNVLYVVGICVRNLFKISFVSFYLQI
jgi:hypothetical protein